MVSNCKNDPNLFCYICGKIMTKNSRRNFTEYIIQLYENCFNAQVINQNELWAPNYLCNTCYTSLMRWKSGNTSAMKIKVPMIWREPDNHDDCYFCATKVNGTNKYSLLSTEYPEVTSVTTPILKNERELREERNQQSSNSLEQMSSLSLSSGESADDSDEDVSTYKSDNTKEPMKFDQGSLNDLVRDLGLSKESSELLASRLRERNLLLPETRVTFYRTRDKSFRRYFTKEDSFVYCNDINGLFEEIKPAIYEANDWRLFIDSSKYSIKVVLLHNTNKFAPVPIGHSVVMKEEYNNISTVLDRINYAKHKWLVCGDLKIISMILGQQSGFTKYPCFICEWDSRDRQNHWTKKTWTPRKALKVKEKNIVNEALVSREKILLPPLHIKLGLMKQFVKALNKEGQCFRYLIKKFPKLSEAKIKEGIFDGPQIRMLLNDSDFINEMNEIEKAAWLSFKKVVKNFLGIRKNEKYKEIVEEMLKNFQTLGCLMNLKIHFLHSHLDKFPENLADFSEEQGERFHQDIKTIEERYQGRWDENMLADYCWLLKRDQKDLSHKRKAERRSFEDGKVRSYKKSRIS